FALWITDLSERDPYYVTPVIMGATMWLQQLWTPAAGDPTQQMMMRFMPVIFTVSFLKFPSGLVLNWMFSNLVGIAQQWYIRRSPKRPWRAPRPTLGPPRRRRFRKRRATWASTYPRSRSSRSWCGETR